MAKTDRAEIEIKAEEDKITGEDKEVEVKVEGEDQGGITIMAREMDPELSKIL